MNINWKKQMEKFGRVDIEHNDIQTISTGLISFDLITGIGGLPIGRITEIYGPEAVGKSTLLMSIFCNLMQDNKNILYIDTDKTMAMDYFEGMGMSNEYMRDHILFLRPETGDDAFSAIKYTLEHKMADVIVIDTLSALCSISELSKPMGDLASDIGASYFINQNIKGLSAMVGDSGAAVVILSQVRMRKTYGTEEDFEEQSNGGKALKFHASLRIYMAREKDSSVGGNIIGHMASLYTIKNKCSCVPFKKTHLELVYLYKISDVIDIIKTGIALGVIGKNEKGEILFKGEVIAKLEKVLTVYRKKYDKCFNELKSMIVEKYKKDNVYDIKNDFLVHGLKMEDK